MAVCISILVSRHSHIEGLLHEAKVELTTGRSESWKWDFHDKAQDLPVLSKVMVCCTHLEVHSYVTGYLQPQILV